MSFTPTQWVAVEQVDARNWRTLDDRRYVGGKGDEFEVPKDYITDFATVPRIAVWLIAVFGLHTIAAIFHDRLLTHYLKLGLVSSVDADGLFRRMLRELGVPPVRRHLAWVGVRWGALFNRRRRAGWLRTAPTVLTITVLALPLAVPMLVVALGLAVYGAAELVATGGRKKGTLST